MLMPIQSLMNMEMMLGYGYNSNTPSMANGYCMPSSYLNNSMYYPSFGYNNQFGYYPSNINFGQSIPNTYSNPQVENNNTNTSFKCNPEDAQQLANYYAKNNVLEEGFKGALTGGLSWMAFENAQSLIHPLNAKRGFSATEKIFKNASKEFMEKNKFLTQEAYDAAQKLLRDSESKGFWSKWLRKPLDKTEVGKLTKELENALKLGNTDQGVKAVAEVTEKMKAARGFDGRLIIGKKRTIPERLSAKTKEITQGTELLKNLNGFKIGSFVKNAFKKDFWGFMLFETLGNIGKIFTAFNKDTNSGIQQTGQSAVKSAAGVAGWCLGRAAGTWLGAKAGAAIGTAICPGAGTVVGALIGFTVGSIGMWAGHKLAEKVVGQDVADKIEAEEKLKTDDGKAELLTYAIQKQSEGKQLDPKTLQAVQNILKANNITV